MYPFRFALYLNDLESFLGTCNLKGLDSISRDIEDKFDIYLKLLIHLYADDTVFMAESPEEPHMLMDAFDDYCTIWKLKVNVDKTKIMILSKGRQPQNLEFPLHGLEVEVVNSFTYLGNPCYVLNFIYLNSIYIVIFFVFKYKLSKY